MDKGTAQFSVYISSSERDLHYKEELISNLYVWNTNINILGHRVNLGSVLKEVVPSLIRSADLILILVTPNYVDSKFTNDELQLILEAAKEDNTRIIPVKIEPVNELPPSLKQFVATPRNGIPVSQFEDKLEAYLEINDTIVSAMESKNNSKVQAILNDVKGLKSELLDLSNCNLRTIPLELQEMPWIKTLILSTNQISLISNLDKLVLLEYLDLSLNQILDIYGIGQLVNLKYLNLSHNQISAIKNLETLEQLTTLDLYENKIEKIENLEKNKQLTFLGLSGNQLTTLNNIAHLKKLEKLFASYNQISDLSELTTMTSLKRVVLTNNNIESLLPIKPLIENGLQVSLKFSFDDKEEGIFIKDNTNLSHPSIEVIEKGNVAILKYFSDADIHGTKRLEILKLILVGNSRVGKTNLSQFIRGKKVDKNSLSTHILEIHQLEASFLKSDDDTLTRLNIFDFGGQDYYHDTHRLFYTHDTAYILVWDASSNKYSEETELNSLPGEIHVYENFPIEYWLQSIRYNLEGKALNYYQQTSPNTSPSKTSGVPVFILQNKIETYEGKLNQQELITQYPNIWGFFSVSLLNKKRTSILTEVLKDYINSLNLSGRLLIKYEINIVKYYLENTEPLVIISLDDFWKKCLEIIGDPTVKFNRDNAAIMAQILNNVGLVLYDKVDETNGNIYTNIRELNEVVKEIMDVARKGSDKGMFSISQLKKIKYTEEVLALLAKNNSIIRISEDHFLAPQFLPLKPNPSIEFFLHAFVYCQVRILYKAYFHKTLLLNLFATYLKDAKIDPTLGVERFPFWRNGIIVSSGDGITKELVFVEFVKTSEMGIVNIKTMKPFSARGLEKKIENTLDVLNKDWTFEKQISVDSLEFFSIKYLETQVSAGQFVFRRNNKSFTINDFKSLHEFINLPKKLFISYSSKNADFINRFVTHLQILKSSGLIEPWYDRMIESGTRWDDAIRTEMTRSDVIIFLLSPDFIATDYIMNEEIPLAIEQFRNEKSKFFFIQLLPCAWHRTSLKDFQQTDNPGVTKKNVITINKPDNDFAWNKVIDELEEKLKKTGNVFATSSPPAISPQPI